MSDPKSTKGLPSKPNADGLQQLWSRRTSIIAGLPEGIVFGNGRFEAVQVDIAAKYAGRVRKVFAHEGNLVEKDGSMIGVFIATISSACLLLLSKPWVEIEPWMWSQSYKEVLQMSQSANVITIYAKPTSPPFRPSIK